MDTENLKRFRHGVAVLKKQGLLPDTLDSGGKLDARSAYPSWKVRGKKLSTLINKYDDVVSNKVTAVKATSQQLKSYKSLGYETVGNRILIDHAATEKVVREGGEFKRVSTVRGVERIIVPVEYKNLPQWFRDVKANAELINKMKRKNEWFGLRYQGGQRANFFSDVRQLIKYFQSYEAVQHATSRTKRDDVYRHLEIIRMTNSAAIKFERSLPERGMKPSSKEYQRKAAKRKRKALKGKSTTIQERYRRKARERMRKYRASLKADKKAYKQTLRKNAIQHRKAYKKTKKRK